MKSHFWTCVRAESWYNA